MDTDSCFTTQLFHIHGTVLLETVSRQASRKDVIWKDNFVVCITLILMNQSFNQDLTRSLCIIILQTGTQFRINTAVSKTIHISFCFSFGLVTLCKWNNWFVKVYNICRSMCSWNRRNLNTSIQCFRGDSESCLQDVQDWRGYVFPIFISNAGLLR